MEDSQQRSQSQFSMPFVPPAKDLDQFDPNELRGSEAVRRDRVWNKQEILASLVESPFQNYHGLHEIPHLAFTTRILFRFSRFRW